MANWSYILPTVIILLVVVSTVFSCSCKPNLRADACKSDYVIVAKVLGERQMTSQNEVVSHYNLNVTKVLKTSEQYEGAEKVMQVTSGGPAGCEVLLKKGHTYIFSGHVVDYDDEGVTKKFLEVKYCDYVDLKDVAMNKDLLDDIMDMMENPPTCGRRRRITERAQKMTGPITSFGRPKRWNNPFAKRWNNPFRSRWNNPFQKERKNSDKSEEKRWSNPFQKRWSNPFQKRWSNPFQKRWSNPFQKRWSNSFQKRLNQ